MNRTYQHDFSASSPAMFETEGRTRKARTMVAVLEDWFERPLDGLAALDVGASTGIIDDHLAGSLGAVTGIDIDPGAVTFAHERFGRTNLDFRVGDAMRLDFSDDAFDVVICSQVYEHVPDAAVMMAEIHRVLKPGGVCYFAAGNRIMWTEPHYGLPLLSVLPRRLAHLYVRAARRGDRYHELHYSYWGLMKLVKSFRVHDYTRRIVDDPARFHAGYMLPPGSRKSRLASRIANHAFWLMPGYVWLLEKT